MSRRTVEQIVAAAHGVLVEGERIMEQGVCWGVQPRRRLPLLFVRRHQFLMVLTDRRLLLFARHRNRVLRPSDLVLGKRYETFHLDKVRRGRPLLQLVVTGASGVRMALEFRPGRRHLGEALVHRLEPSRPIATIPASAAPANSSTPAPGDRVFWSPQTPSS